MSKSRCNQQSDFRTSGTSGSADPADNNADPANNSADPTDNSADIASALVDHPLQTERLRPTSLAPKPTAIA